MHRIRDFGRLNINRTSASPVSRLFLPNSGPLIRGGRQSIIIRGGDWLPGNNVFSHSWEAIGTHSGWDSMPTICPSSVQPKSQHGDAESHPVLPLAKELLATDSFQEKKAQFFL